jgi:uncharacterized protein (TIGR00304 family)
MLIFIGVVIFLLATVLINLKRGGKGKTKSGGVIIVGPIPIILGSDKKYPKDILVLSIVLTSVLIASMLLYYILFR